MADLPTQQQKGAIVKGILFLAGLAVIWGVGSTGVMEIGRVDAAETELPNCCVKTDLSWEEVFACTPVTWREECENSSFDPGKERLEFYALSCDEVGMCKRVDETAAAEAVPVIFTPQFTIPFSNFVAGEPITVSGSTLGEYIVALYVYFISIAGILSTVMIMYGGIKYVTSFGNQSKIGDAKDTIVSAMIGLALALASYVILVTISPRLVELRDLTSLTVIKRINVAREDTAVSERQGISFRPLARNVSQWDAQLTIAANSEGIDRDLLKVIMMVESSGVADARNESKYGPACGLMQMLESRANELYYEKVSPVTCKTLQDNPLLALRLGARYLKNLTLETCPRKRLTDLDNDGEQDDELSCQPELTKCTNGSLDYVIAGYNGGIGANCNSTLDGCEGMTWWECPKNSGYQETRNYVPKVKDGLNKIKTDPAFAWSN